MIPQIALMLNGPSQWYENILKQYHFYGKTWLQQNELLNMKHLSKLNNTIAQSGYFTAYGYVQKPVKSITYLLHIDLININNGNRLPPPDNTAPMFDETYDVSQGKCKNKEDYRYKMWLRVKNIEQIQPIKVDRFIRWDKDEPLKQITLAPHYYVKELVGIYSDESLRSKQLLINAIQNDIISEEIEERGPQKEGGVKEYYGKRYERSPVNRQRAIQVHGLTCNVCGFNFEAVYGERGADFIEVHHIKPISTFEEEQHVDPKEDLITVCSNCHRMIHRKPDDILTIQQIKELVTSMRGQ